MDSNDFVWHSFEYTSQKRLLILMFSKYHLNFNVYVDEKNTCMIRKEHQNCEL